MKFIKSSTTKQYNHFGSQDTQVALGHIGCTCMCACMREILYIGFQIPNLTSQKQSNNMNGITTLPCRFPNTCQQPRRSLRSPAQISNTITLVHRIRQQH
ncbi:unnamed protein product [Prunus armeniaca]|uniref:Uncharacterized protein n=1 Tax=Prunus armeniaca TaxID=36596 RepID=A0A6J5XK63_PRUAR|nr:unnamed protein product [Prunus armeniaca]